MKVDGRKGSMCTVQRRLNWTVQPTESGRSKKTESGRSKKLKVDGLELKSGWPEASQQVFWEKTDGPKKDTDEVIKLVFMHLR